MVADRSHHRTAASQSLQRSVVCRCQAVANPRSRMVHLDCFDRFHWAAAEHYDGLYWRSRRSLAGTLPAALLGRFLGPNARLTPGIRFGAHINSEPVCRPSPRFRDRRWNHPRQPRDGRLAGSVTALSGWSACPPPWVPGYEWLNWTYREARDPLPFRTLAATGLPAAALKLASILRTGRLV
jgi:hypothetical protein